MFWWPGFKRKWQFRCKIDKMRLKYRVPQTSAGEKNMHMTMIICQNTPEVIWNAFRLANTMPEGKKIW
jgi:hypothetical protein